MQYYKLNKISEGKIKSAEFQILPIQIAIFSQFRTIQIQAFASCAKLNNKETFCQKILRKKRFDHNNVIERPFFTEEVVTRPPTEVTDLRLRFTTDASTSYTAGSYSTLHA